jgi:hypothetical protein
MTTITGENSMAEIEVGYPAGMDSRLAHIGFAASAVPRCRGALRKGAAARCSVRFGTTAADMLGRRRRSVGNGIPGRDTDVGVATLTTTLHAQWSGVFARSAAAVAGGSLER